MAASDDFEYAFSGVIDPPPLVPFGQDEDDPETFYEDVEFEESLIENTVIDFKNQMIDETAGLNCLVEIDEEDLWRRARRHWRTTLQESQIQDILHWRREWVGMMTTSLRRAARVGRMTDAFTKY